MYSEGFAGPPISSTNLIGWWPLNGDTLDYSMNGNNATSIGNVQPVSYSIKQSTAIQVSAAQFNGASSYASTSLAPSTVGTPITISGWVNPPNNPATYMGYFGWRSFDSVAGSGDFYILQLSGSNLLELRFQNSAGTQFDYESAQNVQVNPNTWNFVAFTYNGSYIKAYVNGVPFAPIAASGSFGAGTSSPFTIGALDELGSIGYLFKGAESNIQVYGSALSTSQMSKLYQEGVSGFPIANAKLTDWWPLSGDANDYSSSTSNTVPVNMIYNSIRINSFGQMPSLSGYGLFLNGINSNIVINEAIPTAGNSLSVSTWIYPTSLLSSQSILAHGHQGYAALTYELTTNNFCVHISATYPCVPFNGVSRNSWYNLIGIVSYNSVLSSSNVSVYLNGVRVANALYSGNLNYQYYAPLAIGQGVSGGANFFNGTIADVQVYNNALSSSQVTLLYNTGIPLSRSISFQLGVT